MSGDNQQLRRLESKSKAIGLHQQVKVRASKIQGRGLFATRILPKRRKIGEVSGELLRLPQARNAVESKPKIYLVEVSDRLALDCSRGNCFKYLNHSCRPNCYLRIHLNRVEVYTRESIAPGAELTVDYGCTPHKGGMNCRCGAARCKGVL